MSETDLNREPIELVEIVLPKCANVFGSAPCTATGSQCYNTRATCKDVANYRDTPDRHLTPDLTLTDGDTIASGDLTRTDSIFAAFDVFFATSPDGIIWEQGGSDDGAYLGVTSGNLVFRAGDGDAVPASDIGEVRVDVTPYAGQTLTLYIEIDFTASSTSTIRLWSFCSVANCLTLLGEDTFTASTLWASTNGGAIGTANGTTPTGESTADWNGSIEVTRFYDAQNAPDMTDNFGQSLWLGRGQLGEPTNEKYILPCLDSLKTIGTKINLNAADDNYRSLGRRAMLDFSCKDFTHSDITQDPYVADRLIDPKEQSTFWRKWLRRQKFGRVGATVRVYDGYADEQLADYRKRTYIIEKVDRKEDGVLFRCRDILTRTEFLKAQDPEPSTGILSADINNSVTTMTLTGDVTEDYPATGTVRINDEIITYTGRSYSDPITTFTGLTRASDGSEADEHDAGDLVQICTRFTDEDVSTVVKGWLLDKARIQGQLVDVAEIESESTAYLNAYRVTGLLTEPRGIESLIGKLSEECSFYVWWDERSQKIRLKAIRAVAFGEFDTLFSHEDNIIADSMRLEEKPKQRLNIITAYYNPANFAGDLDKPSNFKNGLKLLNGTTSLPEQYGGVIQTREIFSEFLTTEAEINQTLVRLNSRYADVPEFSMFMVDAKDREKWVGDIVQISHPLIVDADGERDLRRWLITYAEEIDPGHIIKYECADITLDGFIYLITANGIGNYTAELFAQGNAFITDNFGLNPDGTEGAKIS